MAGVSGWSWPIPFVVPPCTQSAILRNRHKVPRGSGSYGLLGVKPHRIVVAANLTAKCSSPILLRGYRPQRCQVAAKGPRNAAERVGMTTQLRPPKSSAAVSFGYLNRSWPARSGACAGFDGAVGTIGVDIERAGGTLDHFARDHDLFDAFQARQIEHGFEQDAFENRTQAARAGLALDRLAGDCAKRLVVERPRAEMIFSRPENAPPQMNRIFVVSTCRNSCCGCLRPPCGGTEATVPSMILSSACCTPSPDTSRVIEGLSDLRCSRSWK